MRFSIIIPNYNSEKWIDKLLYSILQQTYTDYEVIIVDDMSTDNSVSKIKEYSDSRIRLIELKQKRWNGGSRNVGVENAKGDYVLFADCDDWFYSCNCLEIISDIIEKRNPHLIRLPYHLVEIGESDVILNETSISELAKTVYVAPWTKCVKRELFVPFPENTLIEDVVQHIAQIDNIGNYELCSAPIIVWNRKNKDAISAIGHKYTQYSKRYSSIYRNIADLIDLKCKHDYCEEQRKWRLKNYLDIVHTSKEDTIVKGGQYEKYNLF